MKCALVPLVTLLPALGLAHAAQTEQLMGPAIESGSKVQIEYTLTDDAGTVIDSNKGGQALSYTHGQHHIIPGLESALTGMHPGGQKTVSVKPEDGYGVVDPKAEIEVNKDVVPPAALKVGTTLQGRSNTGEPMLARVKEIREKTVVLDLNHPLAGKTLHFDVKILGVDRPTK